jgi:hypothetical protein
MRVLTDPDIRGDDDPFFLFGELRHPDRIILLAAN